jgi:hypothetical protein
LRRDLQRLTVESREALSERFAFPVPPAGDVLVNPCNQNPDLRSFSPLLDCLKTTDFANAMSPQHRSESDLSGEVHALPLPVRCGVPSARGVDPWKPVIGFMSIAKPYIRHV